MMDALETLNPLFEPLVKWAVEENATLAIIVPDFKDGEFQGIAGSFWRGDHRLLISVLSHAAWEPHLTITLVDIGIKPMVVPILNAVPYGVIFLYESGRWRYDIWGDIPRALVCVNLAVVSLAGFVVQPDDASAPANE